MGLRECTKCEEDKKSGEFYKSCPNICRECRIRQTKEAQKERKSKETQLLLEMHEDQQTIIEQMHDLTKEVKSLKKMLKKLSM